IELALTHKKDSLTGQMGLFSIKKITSERDNFFNFSPRAEWPDREKLEKEHEVAGFYISSHPLEIYQAQCKWFGVETFEQAAQKAKNSPTEYTALFCALLKTRKNIVTKKGDRMSFMQLEDMTGSAEIIVFPKTFAKTEKWLDSYQVFIIKGTVDTADEAQLKIKAQDMVPVELALNEWPHIEYVSLSLPHDIQEESLQVLKNNLAKGKLTLHIIFHE